MDAAPQIERPALAASTASEEWRRGWPLPFVGMLGLAGGAMFTYASGVFMLPITQAFGWSRAQYSFALTLAMLTSLVATPLSGRLVDSFGPRRVALAGCVVFPLGLSVAGAMGGRLWQWYGCALLLALLAPLLSPMVWSTAIVSRFKAGRGLALGVTLAGVGLSAAVWPSVTNLYLGQFGWRLAFPALAATWLVVAGPLILLFFRPGGSPTHARAALATVAGVSFRRAVLSWRFLGLALSGGLLSLAVLGVTVHIVPILVAAGAGRAEAAGIAALLGVFSIVGRVATGWLIDRLPARRIGAAAFLLPVGTCLLLRGTHVEPMAAVAAAALMGLASGAELDVLTYLASRYFGLRSFGAIMGLMQSVFAAFAGLGPLLAGAAFDAGGGYQGFLLALIPVIVVSALLIWNLPAPPERAHDGEA